MKVFFCVLLLFLLTKSSFPQNVSGKWYGKLTQGPGGYSELYDFELNLFQKRNIRGDSYAYFKDSVAIRIGLYGYLDGDTIRLSESKDLISEDKVPFNWVACIKNINLKYRKEENDEFLEGSWDGVSKNEGNPCAPGKVLLARNQSALNHLLEENKFIKKTQSVAEPGIRTRGPVANLDFGKPFLNTAPRKITEIIVNNTDLQIQLLDYMKVDNDTVSVYLNRQVLIKNAWISKQPIFVHFHLNPQIPVHELLLYAENLGEIPPNTSELLIIDGDNTFRIMIESDKQKTAAVYLRYQPYKE